MKTNIFSPKKTSLYSLIGFLSIVLTSCGSYQNSSYYESDGIYGATARPVEKIVDNNQNTHYQDYFNSLQNNNQPTEIFTDVDNYGSYDNLNDSIQVTNPGYAGWGSSPENVSVSFYDNGWTNWYGSSWGWGFGFSNWYGSWGYPYYGGGYPGYGWGYPSYGWGYPGYGWGYPNYGYNNNYSYNSGRRGTNYANNNSNRNYTNRNYTNTNSQTDFRRNSNAISRPNYTNTRNNGFQPRNSTNAYPTRTRVNTNTNSNTNSRSQNYAPSRSSYTPSSNSSSSSRSSGGGGGGGRSSGGGGRSGRG
jgi:hypothetical protein